MARETLNSGTAESRGVSLASIGAWLSVIAAIVVPIYGLSFTVLVVQLRATYKFDWPTSWYAASLASERLVAGVALAFLLSPGVLISLIGAALLAVALLVLARLAPLPRNGDWSRYRDYGWRKVLESFLFRRKDRVWNLLTLVQILTPVALILVNMQFGREWWRITTPILGTVTGSWGSVLMIRDLARGRPLPVRILRLLSLFYVYLLVTTAVQARILPPPLPPVELSDGTQGRLLGHSDGYWAIIVGPDAELRAVPEEPDKVTVRTRPSQPSGTPSVVSFPAPPTSTPRPSP